MILGVVGLGYALTDRIWILILLALFGTMSTDANDNGPLTTLEQAMIGQAPAASRLRVFGRYNAIAFLTGAVGALAAGGPAFLHQVWAGRPPIADGSCCSRSARSSACGWRRGSAG